MKKNKKLLFIILMVIIVVIIACFGILVYLFLPVSNKFEEKNIIIENGSTISDVANTLKKEKLIKNENIFKLYLKIKGVDNIYAASYYLSPDMNINEITKTLLEGGHNANEISITFIEGINIMQIAEIIEKNTNNSKEDVYKTLKDKDYITSLIDKYWFLTDDIKNKEIYYPLEGYLFPDTYFFSDKDVSVKEIFESMLDTMEKVLNPYKEKIKKSDYSIHKLMTLASITQSEGVNADNFKNIASVFYNRLKDNTALGSCVTSYYGVKKLMTEELYAADINDDNAYNTRGHNPRLISVGPISSPGKNALDAVFNPINTKYYYFVSDKNRKLYFTKTLSEHEQMISKLQNEGLWYEW